jgi:photosystem II stability/assembly factor-like uncharacterized protein
VIGIVLHGTLNGLLFTNVYVGGLPRSVDGGVTWTPTIDVNLDAHQVCVDSNNADLVVAATAAGLCISYDGGRSWSVHAEGLHAPYCSAVAVVDQMALITASGSVYVSNDAGQAWSKREEVVPGVSSVLLMKNLNVRRTQSAQNRLSGNRTLAVMKRVGRSALTL